MAGPVDGRAHVADPAGDPGRGLVVDDADGLDLARPVLRRAGLDLRPGRRRGASRRARSRPRGRGARPARRHSGRNGRSPNISTRSPGESVFTRAASQAPVPEAGNTMTGCAVWKTVLRSARRLLGRGRRRPGPGDRWWAGRWRAGSGPARWSAPESEGSVVRLDESWCLGPPPLLGIAPLKLNIEFKIQMCQSRSMLRQGDRQTCGQSRPDRACGSAGVRTAGLDARR